MKVIVQFMAVKSIFPTDQIINIKAYKIKNLASNILEIESPQYTL